MEIDDIKTCTDIERLRKEALRIHRLSEVLLTETTSKRQDDQLA